MKSNQQVEPKFDMDAQTITMTFGGDLPDIVVNVAKIHPAILARAAYVGLANVRLADAGAVERVDPKTKELRSAAEMLAIKHERMARIAEHLMSGTDQWRLNVAEGGGAKSITIEAVANLSYSGDYEKAEAALDRLAEKKGKERSKLLADFRDDPKVAEEIERIRASRPKKAAKVSAENLLAELAE